MFKKINVQEAQGNPFIRIGKQWMLITALRGGKANTMTASWGGLGVLWNKNVATLYIRPQRYTREFVEAADVFTLSFLPEKCRAALNICGSESGRDGNKIAKAGLELVVDGEAAYFQEAELVFVCRKLYSHAIDPNKILREEIFKNYPQKDYHTIYIGEIEICLSKQTE